MRAVVQRCTQASVSVEGETVGAVSGPSLAVLVGVGREDTEEQVEWLARKLLNMRLWAGDDEKPWARSVRDMGGSVLVVSQFTLHGKLKGNKPDWGRAAGPEPARALYESLLARLRSDLGEERVAAGVFGAMMACSFENDGPVTMVLDSDAK
eukprot:PRCOL_00003508-RA